jgi:hypothetical protein
MSCVNGVKFNVIVNMFLMLQYNVTLTSINVNFT